jgi:Zn-dependent protease
MDNALLILFQFIVLIFSVMVHEIAHGAVALRLGDDTAKRLGRLTLNPVAHIDPFGSILLPLALVALGSPFVVGWAKPVPYNPLRLRDPKRGAGLIALAGPATNLVVAMAFGLFARFAMGFVEPPLIGLFSLIVLTNVSLALFNLIPIPPLDGSGVLFSILPSRYAKVELFLVRYGLYVLLAFLFLDGFRILEPVAFFLYRLFVGGV